MVRRNSQSVTATIVASNGNPALIPTSAQSVPEVGHHWELVVRFR
jgi:hypothetical protein